jgi:hypothetical protein
MNPPDTATRLAAVRVLNSSAGRALSRMVHAALVEGRVLQALDVAVIVVRLGETEAVAEVVAQAIVWRASASIVLQHVERERVRVRSIEPVAHVLIGRLRRRAT